MSCHEKLIAKKKKYDLKKKQMAQLQQQRESEEGTPDYLQTPPQAYDVLRHLQERSNSSTSILSNSPSMRDSIDTTSDVFMQPNKSNSSLSTKDKVLPPPPNIPPSKPSLLSRESFKSTKTDNSLSSAVNSTPTSEYANPIAITNEAENDYSIEEVNDSDDELNKNNTTRKVFDQKQSQVNTPPASSKDQQSKQENAMNGIRLDIVDSSEPTTPRHNRLQPAATFTPQSKESIYNGDFRAHSPTSISKAQFKGKNLLILSPNILASEFNDAPKRAPSPIGSPTYDMVAEYDDSRQASLSAPIDELKLRSGCPSPFAKANRQARVVEASDYAPDNAGGIFLENDNKMEEGFEVIRTPKKLGLQASNINTTSPPPKLPLPVIPSSPVNAEKKTETPTLNNSAKFNYKIESTPKGLGLAGIDYDDKENIYSKQEIENPNASFNSQIQDQTQASNQVSPATPAVTNLESTPGSERDVLDNKQELSRKSSLIRTPKLSLKHKRSISGGSGGISQKFNFFKSNKDEAISEKPRRGSAGSISNGSAYATPSLPRTSPANYPPAFQTNNGFIREHNRSTSDTPFTTVVENKHASDFYKYDSELKSVKTEVHQLDSQKVTLINENKLLKADNENLSEKLKSIQKMIDSERTNYENLSKEIVTLEKRKKDLLEVNQSLSEQNHKLESSIHTSSSLNQFPSNDTSYMSSLGGTTINTGTVLPSQNSSSSLIAGVPYNEMNGPEDHNTETQKATRLKFWRRPKAVPNLVSSNSSVTQAGLQSSMPTQQSNHNHNQAQSQNQNQNAPAQGYGNQHSQNWNNASNAKLSQAYASQAIRPPKNYVNGNTSSGSSSDNGTPGNDSLAVDANKKGLGSFMPKSRSSNILDSFLTGNSNNNSPVVSNDNNDPISLAEIDSAPLFTSSIQKRAEYENEKVPLIITKCIAEVEKRGLDMEGIYRISGGNSAIVAIENAFANLPPNSSKDEKHIRKLEETISVDINAVTSALKRYLRKLPEPLLPYAYYDEYIKVGLSIPTSKPEKRITELRTKVIDRLPPTNRHALHLICKHLDLVNSYSSVNRMTFKNLSVVFAPTLVRDETGEKEMIHMGHRNDITELMLTNYQKLF